MNRKKVANNKDSKNLSRLKIFKCFLYGFGTLNLHNEDSHKVYAEFIKECLKNNNFLPQSKSLPEIAYSIKESQHNIPVLYIYYSNRATYQDNAEGVWNIVVEEKILKLQPVCERKFHFIKNKDLKKIGIGKSKQEQLQTLEIDPQENKVEVDNNFLVKEELKQDTAQKNEQLTPSHFQVLDEIEIVLKKRYSKEEEKKHKIQHHKYPNSSYCSPSPHKRTKMDLHKDIRISKLETENNQVKTELSTSLQDQLVLENLVSFLVLHLIVEFQKRFTYDNDRDCFV